MTGATEEKERTTLYRKEFTKSRSQSVDNDNSVFLLNWVRKETPHLRNLISKTRCEKITFSPGK